MFTRGEAETSHWHHLVEDFQTSALEFYTAVEEAVQRRQVPEAGATRIEYKEGGLLTARRVYLRVQRGKVVFDICAAPFGTGYFFSWWMTRLPPSLGFLWLFLLILSALTAFGILARLVGFSWAVTLSMVLFPAAFWFLGQAVRVGELWNEEDVLAIPGVGWLYNAVFRPITYYRLDTALMFQETVHRAVLECIERVKSSKGIRAMTELEQKPILRELLPR